MKTVKKLIIFALGVILTLFLVIMFFINFKSDLINQTILKKLNESISAECSFSNIELLNQKTISSVKVSLDDVCIKKNSEFYTDTIFYSKKCNLSIPLIRLLNKKISFSSFEIYEGKIKLIISGKNKNFESFINSEQSTEASDYFFEKIKIFNTVFEFNDVEQQNSILIDIADLSIKNKKSGNFSIKGELFVDDLIFEKNHLNNKNISLDGQAKIKNNIAKFEFKKLITDNLEGAVTAFIENWKTFEINFDFKNQEITDVIANCPSYLDFLFKNINTSATISFKGFVKRKKTLNKNPEVDILYFVKNGSININESALKFNDIFFNGRVTNGKVYKLSDTKFTFENFSSKTKYSLFNGAFSIKNLEDFFLDLNLDSQIGSSDLKKITKNYIKNIEGKLYANFDYLGRLSFNHDLKNHFISSKHKIKINSSNLKFEVSNIKNNFNVNLLDLTMANNDLNINSLICTNGESDFKFKGDLLNLPNFLAKENKTLSANGDITSTYINFDDLLNDNSIDGTKKSFGIPYWLNLNVKLKSKNLKINQFDASEVESNIDIQNQVLNLNDIKLRALNGSVFGNIKTYKTTNKEISLKSSLNFKNINIRQAFSSFNNFNQSFIESKHIKGVGTAKINLSAVWDDRMKFNKKKLALDCELRIEKGELINFKPLRSLSNFVSIEDLRDVKFSKLENKIEIENNTITIPQMQIVSSALSLVVSGTHSLDNDIDYNITLLLSELMSNEFRKRNTKINKEIGEIKTNNDGLTTIFLKMTGTTEETKIYFDNIKFNQKINSEIEKEKKSISEIIKSIDDSAKIKNVETEPDFEWDDNKL